MDRRDATEHSAKKFKFDEDGNMVQEEIVIDVPEPLQPVYEEPVVNEKDLKKRSLKLQKRERMREKRFNDAVKIVDQVFEAVGEEGVEVAVEVKVSNEAQQEPQKENSSSLESQKENMSIDIEKQPEVIQKEIEAFEKVASADSKKQKIEPPKEEETKASKAKDAALAYLIQFINDKPNWKFQKVRQTWILRNLYFNNQVDHIHFKHCLAYMEGMGQKAKDETVAEARKFVEEMKEKKNLEVDAKVDLEAQEVIYKRAKKIEKRLA